MSSGPRVLQVLQPEDGGVAEHVLLLSRALAERGWAVEVAASGASSIRGPLREAGIRCHRVALARETGLADARAAGALRRLDRRGRYAIVHAHSSKAGALARLALPRRRRIVYTAHSFAFVGDFPRAKRLFYAGVEQALLPITGAVIAISEFERDTATARLRGASRRLRLIRNGVAPCPDAEPEEDLLAFKGDAPLAGMVSVLRPQKDPLSAVRAAALLADRGALPGRLAVVGNGWLEEDVRREIERLDVGDHVRWFPFGGSMARSLRALDLLVVPSLWEALPLGPIEALTCGVPVLATTVGGNPEIVEDGVTGRLVEPGDPEALARGLAELLGDGELRARMGAAGPAVAAQAFGLERMVDETEALYRELIDRTE